MSQVVLSKWRANLLFGFYAVAGLVGLVLNVVFNCDLIQGALIAAFAAIIIFAFLSSSRAGLLSTFLSLTTFSWISVDAAGSWNYAATCFIAAALVGTALSYFFSRTAAVIAPINCWMLIIGLIAIITGVFAFWRYATFDVLPGKGYINQSVSVLGISSDQVIANILQMTIIYVSWGGILLAAQQVRRQRLFLRDLRRLLLPVAAVNALVAFIQLNYLPLLFTTEKWSRAGQATGLMIDGNSLGMVSAIAIAASPLWLPRCWYKNVQALLTLVFLLFCIFASGSRTAFFLVGIFCVSVVVVQTIAKAGSMRATKIFQYTVVSAVVVILFIGSVYFLIGSLNLPELPLQKRLSDTFDSFLSGTGIDELTNSRIMMWRFSAWMATEHPVSGVGPGTFFCEVGNFARAHGFHYRTIDNAMNLYLHLFVELGLLACISMIIVLVIIFRGQCQRVRQKPIGGRNRELAVAAFLSSLIVIFFFGPHITLPESMFILMLSFGLISRRHRATGSEAGTRIMTGWKAGIAWTVILLLIGLFSCWTAVGMHPSKLWGDLRWHIESGFGIREDGDPPYQWTEQIAVRTVRAKGRFLQLKCWAGDESAKGFRQKASVYLGGEYLGSIDFTDAKPKDTFLKINDPYGNYEKLVIVSDPPFVPDEFLHNGDHRKLGPAIAHIGIVNELYLHSYGFWHDESDGERLFQWSRQEAYRRLDLPKRPVVFHVRVAHPDAADNPVIVTLDINGSAERRIILKDHAWHEVVYQPEEWSGAFMWRSEPLRHNTGFLHLRVSRTWIPAEAGVSDDNRVLGVAMSEIEY